VAQPLPGDIRNPASVTWRSKVSWSSRFMNALRWRCLHPIRPNGATVARSTPVRTIRFKRDDGLNFHSARVGFLER
jgi:hypothetical protein